MRRSLVLFGYLALATPALGQMTEPARVWDRYTRTDVMIPMRDGARLFTTIYAPKDSARQYPILLTRTPYGTDTFLGSIGPDSAFEREGYVFVMQDVRGRYQSEGEFVNVRPFNPNKTGTQFDEASDTYDTIDWLVRQVPRNNGRVGVWGISYLGFYSTMAALSGHPALKAVSPQAPVTDWFLGDDFHHNGAFFLADAFNFMAAFGVPRPAPTRKREPPFNYGTPDGYRFFLNGGSIAELTAKHFGDRIPFWNEMLAHPTYDAFWKARTPLPHLRGIQPAVLTVGSWFDAENTWGALQVYRTLERQNPGHSNALVMGPWYHGQWWFEEGYQLGEVRWGSPTTRYYIDQILLPFFNHHLKGTGDGRFPEAHVYESGTNRWRTFDTWPPAGTASRRLYLGAGGTISFDRAPAPTDRGFDQYWSDPARPVPYLDKITTQRPGSAHEYMVWDQRFASTRPDVLVYQTEPLADDLTLAGPMQVSLSVATSGSDGDWIVKVIDVYPNDTPDPQPNPTGVRLGGYQQLLRGDVMRARFRDGFERPKAMVPNQPATLRFELNDVLHTFRRGHRLMIQIQSSWFPLVDRNPQRFVDIYRATSRDFQPAWMRVYRDQRRPSFIDVGTLP
ncbi:MAG: CocE/NonD family hydrolase [Gemmatimonadales bacterium]|nr:CocE/NonD family hydrolase [Gemmatimonadales bacterium]